MIIVGGLQLFDFKSSGIWVGQRAEPHRKVDMRVPHECWFNSIVHSVITQTCLAPGTVAYDGGVVYGRACTE